MTAKGLENVIRKVIGKVKIAHVTCQSVDDALQGLKQRLASSRQPEANTIADLLVEHAGGFVLQYGPDR